MKVLLAGDPVYFLNFLIVPAYIVHWLIIITTGNKEDKEQCKEAGFHFFSQIYLIFYFVCYFSFRTGFFKVI